MLISAVGAPSAVSPSPVLAGGTAPQSYSIPMIVEPSLVPPLSSSAGQTTTQGSNPVIPPPAPVSSPVPAPTTTAPQHVVEIGGGVRSWVPPVVAHMHSPRGAPSRHTIAPAIGLKASTPRALNWRSSVIGAPVSSLQAGALPISSYEPPMTVVRQPGLESSASTDASWVPPGPSSPAQAGSNHGIPAAMSTPADKSSTSVSLTRMSSTSFLPASTPRLPSRVATVQSPIVHPRTALSTPVPSEILKTYGLPRNETLRALHGSPIMEVSSTASLASATPASVGVSSPIVVEAWKRTPSSTIPPLNYRGAVMPAPTMSPQHTSRGFRVAHMSPISARHSNSGQASLSHHPPVRTFLGSTEPPATTSQSTLMGAMVEALGGPVAGAGAGAGTTAGAGAGTVSHLRSELSPLRRSVVRAGEPASWSVEVLGQVRPSPLGTCYGETPLKMAP